VFRPQLLRNRERLRLSRRLILNLPEQPGTPPAEQTGDTEGLELVPPAAPEGAREGERGKLRPTDLKVCSAKLSPCRRAVGRSVGRLGARSRTGARSSRVQAPVAPTPGRGFRLSVALWVVPALAPQTQPAEPGAVFREGDKFVKLYPGSG